MSGATPENPRRAATWSRYAIPSAAGITVVRFLIERGGRRILRALDERCPERAVDADSETDTWGGVVLLGGTV